MRLRTLGWATTFAVLMIFAIPWFLWGSSRVVAGLPVWLWWHVGWMILAAIVFHRFAQHAWGLGVSVPPSTEAGNESGGENP